MSTEQRSNIADLSERWTSAETEITSAVQSVNSAIDDLPGSQGLLDPLSKATRPCVTTMRGALHQLGRVSDLTTLAAAGNEMTKYTSRMRQFKGSINRVTNAARERSYPELVRSSLQDLRSVIRNHLLPFEKEVTEAWLELYTQYHYGSPIVRDQGRDTVSGWKSIAELCQASQGELDIPSDLFSTLLTFL
jgi:hypothetical protein